MARKQWVITDSRGRTLAEPTTADWLSSGVREQAQRLADRLGEPVTYSAVVLDMGGGCVTVEPMPVHARGTR